MPSRRTLCAPFTRFFRRTATGESHRIPRAFPSPIAFLLVLLLSASPCAGAQGNPAKKPAAGDPLKVSRITPAGADVPAGRQVVFEFNRPMVPLGRMERQASEIPITIEPKLQCRWRWLNPSTLACQLDEKDALRPATRYAVKVGTGFKSMEGEGLKEPVTHTFTTERPRVSSSPWFKEWLSPVMPRIVLDLNQPVQEKSLAQRLFFTVADGKRIPARIEQNPSYAKADEGTRKRHWIVSPVNDLPANKGVRLHVEPGIVSTVGPEPGAENRILVEFQTFPEFRFIGVECRANNGKDIFYPLGAPVPDDHRCNPSGSVTLRFTAPPADTGFQEAISFTPPMGEGLPDYDPWEDANAESSISGPHKKGETYGIYLPSEVFKPWSRYHVRAAQGEMKDAFGRPLANVIDSTFAMDHRLPAMDIYSRSAVLEKGLDTDLPLVATNITGIDFSYSSVTAEGVTPPRTETLQVPVKEDVPQVVPMGVRKLLPKESGALIGRVTHRRSAFPEMPDRDGDESEDAWFFAQVTPFQVHVKLGHHNTVVWVTDLKTGQPVPDVDVDIYQDAMKGFTDSPKVLSHARTGGDGLASLAGSAQLDPKLDLMDTYDPDKPRLIVRCRKDADMALVPLDTEFRIDTEGSSREYLPIVRESEHGHIRTWGATAQGIYKVGDTVQFKIYVRDQGNLHFVPAPQTGYTLKVTDPMDKVVHEVEQISLSDFGAYDGEFTIPSNGAVGWYLFELSSSFSDRVWEPMRVLVSDFTPSPFKVTTDLNGSLFTVGDRVKVVTEAKLHAGGPFAEADVRIVAIATAQPLTPQDPKARDFRFDTLEWTSNDSGGDDQEPSDSLTIFETEGKLDDKGVLETDFQLPSSQVLHGRMTVESNVRDDRGKDVANRASAAYAGRDRYVGLMQSDWILQEGKPSKASVLVVDQQGNITPATPVNVKVEWEKRVAAKVKGPGRAYLTQYSTEWIEEGSFDLASAADPVAFDFTPKNAGRYRITASITDTAGRIHKTRIRRYVTGKSNVVWETTPGNVMRIDPEKEKYQVGDTARFLVRNPFPGAQALITVERIGVIQSWVKVLPTATEVVEVPVQPDYLPGFYFSVLVVSPRVDKPVGPEGDDLGKPTYAVGYAVMPVEDSYKELSITARAEKEEYRPRDTVVVNIEARPKQLAEGETAPPIELAVAVLDDSVFDLLQQGRKAFDPYEGFYHLEDLDVVNYNILMHLIGREKIETKGANPGGGGGPDLGMRSVFKFVSYWNPSIPVDGDGKARIQFEAPDNLTGWRVLAMGVTKEDRMGLGETVFKVNKLTEIRPILPNQVMEGDSFEAGFTVMNRTDAARTLDVTVEAAGAVEKEGAGEAGASGGAGGAGAPAEAGKGEPAVKMTRRIAADPYKRITVRMPVKAAGPGEIVFTVRAGDQQDKDSLRQTLEALKRRSMETAAVYGTTDGAEVVQPVVFPDDMRPDTGTLAIGASPSVIGDLEGAFRYLREYPLACWEQKLTRAVAAAFYQKLQQHMGKSFSWPESAELPAKILAVATEFQAPNGGMAYFVPQDEYASPYLSAFTAMAFNWLRECGYTVPKNVEDPLHDYLQKLLRQDKSPEFYTAGMLSTVRAVTLAALADAGKIAKEDIDRYATHVPQMNLFGKIHYLRALLRFPGTAKAQQDILKNVLSHADQSSGMLVFTEKLDTAYKVLLSSPMRDNGAILSGLLAFEAANPASKSTLGDIPFRLMRSLAQGRKGLTHWASTQENLFALKGIIDFAGVYESKQPDLTVRASLDAESLGQARFTAFTDPSVRFEHPIEPGDVGRKAQAKIQRTGEGRVYYDVTLTYSPARFKTEPVNAGIEAHREYSVKRGDERVLLQNPAEIRTGELVRVDLFVSVPAERYFVVVEDPVPGGLEPVNRELATASAVAAGEADDVDYPEGSRFHSSAEWSAYGASRLSFYHKELRHSVVRFYSEVLAPGRYHLSYTAQAVAPGEFSVLPLRAEQMYEPDVFGKGVPMTLKVGVAEQPRGGAAE